QNLRRALSFAIDRDKILNECFRDPQEIMNKPHRPLNGPYPADSWAIDKKMVPPVLYDSKQASSQANLAKCKGMILELKFPTEPPEVAQACAALKDQIAQHTGVQINLKPCTPTELRRAVEIDHDFQLAYYYWDYADESYWLWPLFDPNSAEAGGRNFLGRLNAPALANVFRKTMQYRGFT